MTSEAGFGTWMGGVQARMEAALARLLPEARVAPGRLHEAMRYATLEGGKRVRPLLCFAAGEACGAAPERLEVAASAVEMIHAYSLVHDDMPCMDNDVLRRGKPTVHVQFDEAAALLVGDALQSLAFQLLSETPLAHDPARQLGMVKLLAVASGSRGSCRRRAWRPGDCMKPCATRRSRAASACGRCSASPRARLAARRPSGSRSPRRPSR